MLATPPGRPPSLLQRRRCDCEFAAVRRVAAGFDNPALYPGGVDLCGIG